MSRTWILFILLVTVIVLGPTIVTDPQQTAPDKQLMPPSSAHPLGTDVLGRDVLSRTLHGGRYSLGIAFIAILWVLPIGMGIGSIAGYWADSWFDRVTMQLVNALLALPGILFALVLLTLMGRGSAALIAATALSQLAPFIQVSRAVVRSVQKQEHVVAARALGASHSRVIRQHILPLCWPTLRAYGAVTFSYALITVGTLGFLGLLPDLSVPEWGQMAAEGRSLLRTAPWVSLAPGTAITLTALLVNRMAVQRPSSKRGE